MTAHKNLLLDWQVIQQYSEQIFNKYKKDVEDGKIKRKKNEPVNLALIDVSDSELDYDEISSDVNRVVKHVVSKARSLVNPNSKLEEDYSAICSFVKHLNNSTVDSDTIELPKLQYKKKEHSIFTQFKNYANKDDDKDKKQMDLLVELIIENAQSYRLKAIDRSYFDILREEVNKKL